MLRCDRGCILTRVTRKQVAARLGKSIATVRRIEGVLLHPVRNARGVHRFDPDEVEDLAEDIQNGTVRLVRELQPVARGLGHHPCPRCALLERQLAAALAEAQHQRSQHTHAIRAIRDEQAAEGARVQAESAMLAAELDELVELLNG
jgi:hypothetical protein